jgi:hypothetical protein
MSYREYKDFSDYFHKEWRDDKWDLHREDGPAKISFYPDGSLNAEHYSIKGKMHRNGAPAQIFYNRNGSAAVCSFWNYDKRHRIDGPAYFAYDSCGSIGGEEFWINNKLLGHKEEGFWKLWERLTEVERQATALLKYLAIYS